LSKITHVIYTIDINNFSYELNCYGMKDHFIEYLSNLPFIPSDKEDGYEYVIDFDNKTILMQGGVHRINEEYFEYINDDNIIVHLDFNYDGMLAYYSKKIKMKNILKKY
jgi:hypothetical protein